MTVVLTGLIVLFVVLVAAFLYSQQRRAVRDPEQPVVENLEEEAPESDNVVEAVEGLEEEGDRFGE